MHQAKFLRFKPPPEIALIAFYDAKAHATDMLNYEAHLLDTKHILKMSSNRADVPISLIIYIKFIGNALLWSQTRTIVY